jgi:hypothetical protein
MCLSLGQSRRCTATCVMLGSEWRARQPCVPPFIWLCTDYFRARSELYLCLSSSASDWASHNTASSGLAQALRKAILAPLKTNTRAGYMLRKPARKSRRAERIEKIRPDCAPPLYHRMGNVCYILWATFQSWRRAKARRRKPLEANLAPVIKYLFLSRLFLSLLGCKALVGGRIPLV